MLFIIFIDILINVIKFKALNYSVYKLVMIYNIVLKWKLNIIWKIDDELNLMN